MRKINGKRHYLIIAKMMLCLFFPSALQAQTQTQTQTHAQAQAQIPYQQIGQMMGGYMCLSLMETNTVSDDRIMGEFMNVLVQEYGEANTLLVVSKMEQMFDLSGHPPEKDSMELMRGIFQYISSDATCFEVFVKEEMF